MNQGDRLAFSNGIVVLSVCASLLIVVFSGETHALIPLYMIGVFVSFTLSQSGMVFRWCRLRRTGWRTSAAINAAGTVLTGVVLIIVSVTKAAEGAWIILLLIPCLVFMFVATKRHYYHVASQLTLAGLSRPTQRRNVVLVPIGGVHRAVIEAIDYARSVSTDVRAVYVDVDPNATKAIRCDWAKAGMEVELVVLDSPYRSLMEPLLEYIEQGRWMPRRRATT